MGQVDFALKEEFSWVSYCASSTNTAASEAASWDALLPTSRQFMHQLGLSSRHPHCITGNFTTDAPPMGPLVVHDYHNDGMIDAAITLWKRALPALLAMGELWLRLFSALLAPLGIAYMVWILLLGDAAADKAAAVKKSRTNHLLTILVCALSLASSLVLATDMWYVHQYGSDYGVSMLVTSSLLATLCAMRYKSTTIGVFVLMIGALTVQLAFDWESQTFVFGCADELPLQVSEGLYHNTANPLVDALVQHWPIESRT
jgi:hypothetical protein